MMWRGMIVAFIVLSALGIWRDYQLCYNGKQTGTYLFSKSLLPDVASNIFIDGQMVLG